MKKFKMAKNNSRNEVLDFTVMFRNPVVDGMPQEDFGIYTYVGRLADEEFSCAASDVLECLKMFIDKVYPCQHIHCLMVMDCIVINGHYLPDRYNCEIHGDAISIMNEAREALRRMIDQMAAHVHDTI